MRLACVNELCSQELAHGDLFAIAVVNGIDNREGVAAAQVIAEVDMRGENIGDFVGNAVWHAGAIGGGE